MIEQEFRGVLADLLNRDTEARVREARVREANRKLYRALINANATDVEADLVLAEVAVSEIGKKK